MVVHIQVFRRQRQTVLHEFKASLVDIVSSRPVRATQTKLYLKVKISKYINK